jgi:hypothetical protein
MSSFYISPCMNCSIIFAVCGKLTPAYRTARAGGRDRCATAQTLQRSFESAGLLRRKSFTGFWRPPVQWFGGA